MNSLVAGDLRIETRVAATPSPIQLLWQGKSNERNPSATLLPFFSDVLAEAAVRKVGVELHFERLEYFNSSTITSIIQLVEDARACGVRMTMLYDRELRWQRLSFEPLRVFSNDLFEVRST